MDTLITFLIILNFTLGTALFVVRIAQRDAAYAKEARKEADYKSHFRDR